MVQLVSTEKTELQDQPEKQVFQDQPVTPVSMV